MLRLFRKFGDLLDTVDLGGWLCLTAGMAIVGVTVLAPAWLDVRELRYESAILRREAAVTEARRQNYEGFVHAVEGNDPMLLTRLAWHHLRLKPSQTQVVEVSNKERGVIRLDEWMKPAVLELPAAEPIEKLPNTRLVRLALGRPRPWVLAFGGWLILMGLLLTPRPIEEAQSAASASAPG